MKFVTYNIQYGKGKDGSFDLERTAAAVQGADIIALQEVSRYIPMVPTEDQPRRLGELLHEYYWVYGRISAADNLVDTWVRAGNAEDSGTTCPLCPENETFYDMRIDYGFVSSGLSPLVRKAWIDGDARGSDHQPVWFEVEL